MSVREYVLLMFPARHTIWTMAIARNRTALKAVVAQILALLAQLGGLDTTTVPRVLRAQVLRLLRPAESATRRLIVVAARDVVVEAGTQRVLPAFKLKAEGPKLPRRMSFQLFDPRLRFNGMRKTYTQKKPRISFIEAAAPVAPLFAQSYAEAPRSALAGKPEHADSRRLCLRIKALASALDDLPRQARRLVRWRVRREAKMPFVYSAPLRPGRPPGHHQRAMHPVDEILAHCHRLALGKIEADTS
jgi:hypothetical protein